jgi:hypothetical protein
LLEGGNHVCNNMPFRYRPVIGDFFLYHLGAARPDRIAVHLVERLAHPAG